MLSKGEIIMCDTFDENDFLSEDEDFDAKVCVTKDGRRIKLSEIEDNHLINRVKYFKRMLADSPGEMVYMGDSDYAEDAVECENAHNRQLEEDINAHINCMEAEAKRRGIVL